MPALPTNVKYGTIIGQFVASIGDTSADEDIFPESVPMGGTVTFTPSIPYVKNVNNEINPITIVKTAVIAVLDDEGYLCTNTVDPLTNKLIRGVSLVATDDPSLNPVGWTWNVDYKLTYNGKLVSGPNRHPIAVPMDSVTDLTVASPVAASTGDAIVRGPSGILTVKHGDAGTTLRPDTDGIVYWIGVARPENALPFDWWYSV